MQLPFPMSVAQSTALPGVDLLVPGPLVFFVCCDAQMHSDVIQDVVAV